MKFKIQLNNFLKKNDKSFINYSLINKYFEYFQILNF